MALRLPEKLQPFERFIKFGLVGASGILVNLGVLALLIEVFDVHFALAAVVGIEVSIVTNYYLNRWWTWSDRNRSHWAILSYHGVSLVGAVIQWVVFVLLVGLADLFYVWASMIGVIAAMLLNYFGNHLLTFRHDDTKFTNRVVVAVALLGIIMAVIAAPSLQRLMEENDASPSDVIGAGTFEEVFLEPIVLEGSVSGISDCTIVAANQDPVGGDVRPLGAEAHGRSFALEADVEIQSPGQTAAGPSVCLFIDGVQFDATGSVPNDASRVAIYANGSPEDVSYQLTIR